MEAKNLASYLYKTKNLESFLCVTCDSEVFDDLHGVYRGIEPINANTYPGKEGRVFYELSGFSLDRLLARLAEKGRYWDKVSVYQTIGNATSFVCGVKGAEMALVE